MKLSGLNKFQQRQVREFTKVYRAVHNLNLRLSGDKHERLKMHKMIRWFIQDKQRKFVKINKFMTEFHRED